MTTAHATSAPPSVLRTLNVVTAQLDQLLSGLSAYSDADRALRQVAHEVTAVSQLSTDVDIVRSLKRN